jgi:serine/threonine protein phosphatase 1
MRRFVIGDIHGGHKALIQCLERSGFDRQKDWLVSLGDICDGWPQVRQTVDELLKLKHFKMVLGNHDQWTLRWMENGWREDIWTSQGGFATMGSYGFDRESVPQSHRNLFARAPLYLEWDNKLFVHGGIDPSVEMTRQDPELLVWDRDLLAGAVRMSKTDPSFRYGVWDDIFIGHTTTECYRTTVPIHACNVWAIDTGGGWSGPLTIMDIDSHQYWQSDPVPKLYPECPGRR